ncbi:phosphorylated adapter RNA export protein-like [Patiria miniata]|uniref:Phosphorylated adapter RNA export protein n=1 Tax=Patiria miniata TaxID=46514 RepID=A0A914AXA1_PATMI|nr:phosphorylated adapter RNA export protein-like [Patiria miniata]XP_038068322.1 phosphorylated adapter RNA export protein-like [Patiria miniata]
MASYRDVRPVSTNSSDDSSGDSNSDSEEDQPWKRRKATSQSQGIRSQKQHPIGSDLKQDAPKVAPGNSSQAGVKRPRRNNVWGEVVQQQNEALVAREMDEFGMDLNRSRDVESYNYKLDTEENASRVYLGAPSVSKPESNQGRNLKRGIGEADDDSWLVNPQRNQTESGERKPVHDRLGERVPSHRPIAKARLGSRVESSDVTPMKLITIDPALSKKEITGKLAYSLQEPKRELIVRVVDTLGVEKSLELWNLTADIEKDGGMMILNGSRRRSPGGVFLQLMKTDPQVTKEQVNKIFAEERKNENEQKHKRERRRKRKKTVKFKEEVEEAVPRGDEEATEVKEERRISEEDEGPSVREAEEVQLKREGQGLEMEDGEIDDEEEKQEEKTLIQEEQME